MKTWLVLLAALVTVGSGGVSAAPAGAPTLRSCGATSVAGKSWTVAAARVPCARAKSLVKQLGARPARPVRIDPALHMGMKCLDVSGKGKRLIHCLSPRGDKQVLGEARL